MGNERATKNSLITNQYISIENSTATAIDDGETFTGGWDDTLGYDSIIVSPKTDKDGILYIDFSPDGTNVDSTLTYVYRASEVNPPHRLTVTRRYCRVRFYNNSGSNQTYLRIQTTLGNQQSLTSPLSSSISLTGDAIATRPTNFYDEARRGLRPGVATWNKISYRTNLTSAGGYQTIWAVESTVEYTALESADTYNISYTQANDGSAANGAKTLTFFHVDSNGNPATATHTLGSDGSDTTSFSGFGINRVAVSSSGSSDTNVSDIIITATTGGSRQATILAGTGVSQQAVFINGNNHDSSIKNIIFNANKLSGANPEITFRFKIYNRAIDTFFLIPLGTLKTADERTLPIEYGEIGFGLSPYDHLEVQADTDQDNTIIYCHFQLIQYRRT